MEIKEKISPIELVISSLSIAATVWVLAIVLVCGIDFTAKSIELLKISVLSESWVECVAYVTVFLFYATLVIYALKRAVFCSNFKNEIQKLLNCQLDISMSVEQIALVFKRTLYALGSLGLGLTWCSLGITWYMMEPKTLHVILAMFGCIIPSTVLIWYVILEFREIISEVINMDTYQIEEFEEITSNLNIELLNEPLNEKMDDKKLREQEDEESASFFSARSNAMLSSGRFRP